MWGVARPAGTACVLGLFASEARLCWHRCGCHSVLFPCTLLPFLNLSASMQVGRWNMCSCALTMSSGASHPVHTASRCVGWYQASMWRSLLAVP